MNKLTGNVWKLAVLALTLTSCSDNSSLKTTETGLKYRFFVQDEKGVKPKVGDMAMIHMIGKTSTDSVIFDTYQNGGGPFEISVVAPTFKGSLEEGFLMMAKGDSALFMVNADSLYNKTFMRPRPDHIKAGSEITFTLKMVNVLTQKEIEERTKKEAYESMAAQDALLKSYTAANGSAFTTTSSGLMYTITKANPKGRKPVAGDTVDIHYTGTLLDGTKFDSSRDQGKPLSIPVGQGAMIPGWEEGMMLMREGEQMKLLIPYSLAYGDKGAGGRIPPYASLLFEMEMVKVKAGK